MRKRALSFLLAFVMCLSLLPATAWAVETEDEFRVVISVEGETIGQGFYVEPKVYTLDEINKLVGTEGFGPYTEDDLTAGMATLAMLIDNGLEYTMTGSWDSDAYLSGIKGIDKGTVDIPAVVEEGSEGEVSTDSNDGNSDEYLGEFDYSFMSGWMITVNDFMITMGCAQWDMKNKVAEGSQGEDYGNTYVIRWQFTVYGYGGDLGIDTGWGMPAYFEHASKDALYTAYALSTDETAKAAALPTMEKLDATEDEVGEALALFDTDEGSQEPEVPEEPETPAEPEVPEERTAQDVSATLDATMEQLAATVTEPAFGTSAGEWSVLSLARGGYYAKDDQYFADYYDRIVETVNTTAASVNKNGALHKVKSTENSRLILALSSIGKNATKVGDWNLITPYEDFTWIKKQGINGPIFALIALDTNNYQTTATDDSGNSIRQQCINYILDKQLDDGGWALSGTASDPDITAMTLQALVNYEDQTNVKDAADKAFAALSNMQKEDGGYASWGTVNSESIAQVIVACTAWGINPDTDTRFVKGDHSAVDALLSFYDAEGKAFKHVADGKVNGMATDQVCYALVAYDRFVNGKTSLYDMSDAFMPTPVNTAPTLKSGIAATDSASVNVNAAWTIDLANIFEDADGDSLTYQVKVGSADYVSADANFSYTPAATGETVLTFTANDGETDSETYTVTLTVINVVEAAPETVVAEGKATATVDTDAMDTAISNAKTGNADAVVIKPTVSDSNVKSVAVELPKASVHSLTSMTSAAIAIESDLGKISIPTLALSSIVEQAGVGKNIAISVAEKTEDDVKNNEQVAAKISADKLTEAVIVEINISAGETNIHAFGGAELTLELPINAAKHEEGKTYTVLAVSADGSVSEMQGTVTGGKLLVKTTHLTTFIATSEEADFTVVVSDSHAGTTGAGTYKFGDTVTLDAGTRSGYTFNGWIAVGVTLSNASSAQTSFAMPANDVAVTANWTKNGGSAPTTDKITVSIRLIGAEEAVQDVDLSNSPYLPSYVTWIPTKSYTLDEGSTVYDLVMKAFSDAGIKQVGADKNYIEIIYAPAVCGGYKLSEFTNGLYSGWMYTIDGKHPSYGLKEQALSDVDVVIWHYVNDYRHEVEDWFNEEDYPALGDGTYWNGWLKAKDPNPSASKSEATQETVAEAVPTAKVDANGSATAEVSAKAMDTLIENAKAAASEGAAAQAFVVVIKPEISGEASKVVVELPKASVSELASSTDATLAIETDLGKVNIPTDALSSIVSQVGGENIRVSMEKAAVADIAPAALEGVDTAALADAVSVKINITSGGRNVTAFGGAALTLELPVSNAHAENKTYLVLAVSDDGTVSKMTGTMVGGALKVVTTHLTTFIATTEETTAFTDIENHWARDDIQYCYANGLMDGVGDGRFDPNGSVTRAMVVTALYRMEGKIAATSAKPFSDVAAGTWYTDAVLWAAENKIVDGYNGKFDPTGRITREQFAVMLYRYASYKKQDVSNVNDLAAYTDAADISGWALSAMRWANAAELITGRTDVTLSPAEGTTRAEMASIMQRFLTAK